MKQNISSAARPVRQVLAFALFAATLYAATSAAHVTLEQPSAPANSVYKAVLRVGHGCDGSPTTGLRVQLPAGFQGAKPMPKPGWVVTTRAEKLAQPYDSHGRQVTEDVVEISWRAAQRDAWLPDAHYDEFIVRGRLPASTGPVWFKVLQTCETGQLDWSQIPAKGTDTQGLKTPAARLDLEPVPSRPPGKAHGHHH